jgi:hypothetical protein
MGRKIRFVTKIENSIAAQRTLGEGGLMHIQGFGKIGKISLLGILTFVMMTVGVSWGGGPFFFLPEEEFHYDVRFLWFHRAAESRLRIRRISKYRYLAEMVAETKGFIGFVTSYRKNYYASEMKYIPHKRRLIPLRFTKIVVIGNLVRTTHSENDYGKRIHFWIVSENEVVKDRGSEPIPYGTIYEDLLSGFFNLRNGAYGPIERGRRITITSQPYSRPRFGTQGNLEKAIARQFVIRIASLPVEQEYRRRSGRVNKKGFLIQVNVPNDFFGQNTGDVLVWLNEKLIPVAAVVEDVILFGDVSGELREVVAKK